MSKPSEAEKQEELNYITSGSAAEKALSSLKNELNEPKVHKSRLWRINIVLLGKKIKKFLSGKRPLGEWGQKQCGKFLKAKGCKILSRNFSCRTGEIDLIVAEPKGTLVFVEVKTRVNENFVDVEATVAGAKRIRMARAANFFIKKHRLENLPLRFDVVIVITDKKTKPQIRHYENAF
jgi:putative endonuclease